jgi:hypothetical protein
MNLKIEVFQKDESLFKGKLLNLPFKKEIILEKSIELFGDDDPCVIHQSYVIRLLVDEILKVWTDQGLSSLNHPSLFSWLDFDQADEIRIEARK